jgi:membrane protease YdiL (CAAX protease family)
VDRWTPWLLLPLKQSVEREVVPLLQYSTTGEFLLISIAAGLGEELFFRGLVQAGIAMELSSFVEEPYAVAIAVAAASIIFGVCHWINRDYAIAATLIGVYLGLLFIYTGNLLAPITTHALYDFVAMWYLVVWKGNQRQWPGASR